MNGSDEDAKDVFQEIVIRFYGKVVKNELEGSIDVGGYLYVMAKNAWLTKISRNKLQTVSGDFYYESPHSEPEVLSIQKSELKKNIAAFFSTLGRRCEELLIYKYYYDYSMKEISEKMEFTSEDSAKTQHYKCKQALIEKVKMYPQFKQLLKDAIE
jgi:RNA polymerase sigma factor (sigma-70 family)